VGSPPDYDAVTGGCWAKGVPLFWRNACVGYSINRAASRKVSYEDAADAMSTAFTRWTGSTCPTDGKGRSRTSIDVRDLGPAECGNVEYVSGAANQNVIVFRDDTWKYGKQVLGLTTVVYAPETGEIYNADMEINTLDMEPLAVKDPVAGDAYDFASVVTHEAGHFLGIAHSDVPGATMYARYNTGQTSMRYLSPDDVQAICTVYRPDGDRAVLNGKITQAPQCDPTPRGGYSPDCQKKPTGCAASTSSSTSPAKPDTVLAWIAASLGLALVLVHRRRERPRA
jgi:MYXO-CTERM domain-containing protein